MNRDHCKHYDRIARSFAEQIICLAYVKLKMSVIREVAGQNMSPRVPKEAHDDQYKTNPKAAVGAGRGLCLQSDSVLELGRTLVII